MIERGCEGNVSPRQTLVKFRGTRAVNILKVKSRTWLCMGRVTSGKSRANCCYYCAINPETIDKIRARTAEAMSRPDVAQRVKMGLERRQQVHSEETKVRH